MALFGFVMMKRCGMHVLVSEVEGKECSVMAWSCSISGAIPLLADEMRH